MLPGPKGPREPRGLIAMIMDVSRAPDAAPAPGARAGGEGATGKGPRGKIIVRLYKTASASLFDPEARVKVNIEDMMCSDIYEAEVIEGDVTKKAIAYYAFNETLTAARLVVIDEDLRTLSEDEYDVIVYLDEEEEEG